MTRKGWRIPDFIHWRVWRCSNVATPVESFIYRSLTRHKIQKPTPVSRSGTLSLINLQQASVHSRCLCAYNSPINRGLITAKRDCLDSQVEENLRNRVSFLKVELVECFEDPEAIAKVLEENVMGLFRNFKDGIAFVELLRQLRSVAKVALLVLDWRRKQAENGASMTSEEYAQGITLVGRIKNVDLAAELFEEAASKNIKSAAIYNALMTTYMVNGFSDKVQSVFQNFKTDVNCRPTIVTYNILISVFARLMLVEHMEAAFRKITDLNLFPNVTTYNNMIAGYVTAWMWDDMEKTYDMMRASPVKPDSSTHSLMLRGYAHSGNMEKMEEMFDRIKCRDAEHRTVLIMAMICAHCKSSSDDRVTKIEALMKLLGDVYRPWLNVLLIRVYAQENLIERMEKLIDEAFERNVCVVAAGIMRSIIASYFRCDALEKLVSFVKRSENAGWRICRSLYHCKMVMFSLHNRIEQIQGVLHEMQRFNLDPSKRTFCIMLIAYSKWGQASQVFGLMFKHGFEFPCDPSEA